MYSTLISCLPIHQSQNKVTAVGDLGQPEWVVIGRLLFLKSSRQSDAFPSASVVFILLSV